MMTEKEKMLAGALYDAADPQLQERWHLAKRLQTEFNNTPINHSEAYSRLLDKLLGSHGEQVWITAPLYVDYGENIHLGCNVEINMDCVLLDCNRITIGDGTTVGAGSVVTHSLPANVVAVGNPCRIIKHL